LTTQDTINQRVTKVRISLGLSQDDIAEAIGKRRPAISKIENGHQEVPNVLLEFYKRKHGVSTDWLLTGEGDMFNEKPTGHTSYSNNQTSGGTNMQGTGNSMSLGNDLAKQLEECRQEVNKWRNKYIELLEKQVGG
jgi:transcriptional regulator with XRE-family HTH domain